METATEVLAVKVYDKGLELACHVKQDVAAALVGDPVRLRQIIINLGGNAIKFTDKGEVVIRVETEKEEESSVLLHFTVSDTGIGIPPEKTQALGFLLKRRMRYLKVLPRQMVQPPGSTEALVWA
jgi:signal transduction histidine kinase